MKLFAVRGALHGPGQIERNGRTFGQSVHFLFAEGWRGVAEELRKRLLSEDLSIWQDIIALESARDWWTQIDEALRSKGLHHFVLVLTPGALASAIVRTETGAYRSRHIAPLARSYLRPRHS